MKDLSHIDRLLTPRSVAVIGASEDPTRIGGRPIAAMLNAGFQGDILPVNPSRDTVQGLTCYASIDDLPQTPDAALIAIPARKVPQAIEALGRKGCKVATLFSAGFAEVGNEGLAAQEGLLAVAQKHGIRLLGPNTLGVYNVDTGYYGTFSSSLDTGYPKPGNIGIASQSGAFGAHLGSLSRDRALGASVLITTGNEADISVADAIHWMALHDGTDVICTYMEAVTHPQALLAAFDAARAAGKPVIALKAGRSALGARAAASHTASLTGDAIVADAVFQDHGVILVRDPETMMDIAYAASRKVFPNTDTLGVITVSGGAGIVISDEAERIGMPMPAMPDEAQKRLKAVLPYASPVNPLDCTAQALNDPALFESFTRAALEDGGYGAALCFLTYVAGSPIISRDILAAIRPLRAEYPDRIIAFCALGAPEVLEQYNQEGILVFNDPCRAVRAIHALCGTCVAQGADRVKTMPHTALIELPDRTPDEYQAKVILANAGIPCAPEANAKNVNDAVTAAHSLGYPVVMKILSPDIIHKSDIGGVMLNLASSENVEDAFHSIMQAVKTHAPDVKTSGVLIAKQLTGGVECLMGINCDPTFGPVAVFGLGGVFVELLDDVALRLCPFDPATAREMILSIRGAPILNGARGRDPVDIDALSEMLSQLSVFGAGAGDRLVSVDLNPVLALPQGQGAFALDAVIEVEERGA